MKNSTRKLAAYKALLPQKLTVEIHKEKDGLWAKVKELPHCYTQADNFGKLIEMLNDAIYTYLDIPTRLMPQLGSYLPQSVVDEIKRQRWQQVFKEIVDKVEEGKRKRSSETFRLSPAVSNS